MIGFLYSTKSCILASFNDLVEFLSFKEKFDVHQRYEIFLFSIYGSTKYIKVQGRQLLCKEGNILNKIASLF